MAGQPISRRRPNRDQTPFAELNTPFRSKGGGNSNSARSTQLARLPGRNRLVLSQDGAPRTPRELSSHSRDWRSLRFRAGRKHAGNTRRDKPGRRIRRSSNVTTHPPSSATAYGLEAVACLAAVEDDPGQAPRLYGDANAIRWDIGMARSAFETAAGDVAGQLLQSHGEPA